jgi:hypothetical protein
MQAWPRLSRLRRSSAMQRAAGGGNLAVLKWAHESGWPLDEGANALAAGGGHLAVLQLARQQGSPWDEWTCLATTEWGHLAALQWVRQQGCSWWKKAFLEEAIQFGHEDVAAWILRQDM